MRRCVGRWLRWPSKAPPNWRRTTCTRPGDKTLESLQAHWQGLTVFVDHPDVPMDNNTAERVQRGPVVGRKNYYGSGA